LKPLAAKLNFRAYKRYFYGGYALVAVIVAGLFVISARPDALRNAPASESFISARIAANQGSSTLSVLDKEEDEQEENASSLDVESADLAAVVSQESDFLVTSNVNEYRDTLVIQKTVAPIQAEVVDKPQTTASGGSLREVVEYVVVQGDTIPSIADKFAISADTVRWANDLTGDLVAPGVKLKILPISGTLVVAEDGDTARKIAEANSASVEEVALFNDLEADGPIVAGTNIIVPGGVKQISRAGSSRSSGSSSRTTVNPSMYVYGGNTYSYGYCTWHASNRRAAIGRPIPNRMGNAIAWARAAASIGYAVDGNPRAGDVLWHKNIGGAGHVAFVEGVNDDGSLLVSDMNYPRWGKVTYRTVPSSDFGKYLFIH
jgi:surface antigen